jgi:hypothetical protein
MAPKQCPECGLVCEPNSDTCECGYSFAQPSDGEMKPRARGLLLYVLALAVAVSHIAWLLVLSDRSSEAADSALGIALVSLVIGALGIRGLVQNFPNRRVLLGFLFSLPLLAVNISLGICAAYTALSGIRMGGQGRRLRGKDEKWGRRSFLVHAARSENIDEDYWREMARDEYESISAFSRLSLQLQALNAPAELLLLTHRAAAEEIGHTQICLAQLDNVTLQDITSDALQRLQNEGFCHLGGSLSRLPRIVLEESLIDGFLNEGFNSDVFFELAKGHPQGGLFSSIAREEGSHADLGRQIVEWVVTHFAFSQWDLEAIKTKIPWRNPSSPVQRAYFDRHRLLPDSQLREIFLYRRSQTLELLNRCTVNHRPFMTMETCEKG